MDLEATLDCLAHLDQLDLKEHQVRRVCKEGKDLLDNLDKLAHQAEAFLMEIFVVFVKQFWRTTLLNLSRI